MLRKFIKKRFPIIVSISKPARIILAKILSDIILKYYLSVRNKFHFAMITKVRRKLTESQRIIVAFLVYNPAIWKYENLYRLFERDDRFLPTIIISVIKDDNPGVAFKTNLEFFSQDHNVFEGNEATYKSHINFHKSLNPDIVVTSSPYDSSFHRNFRSYKLLKYLTIYAQYGINTSNNHFVDINTHNNLLWKYFVESQFHLGLYKKWVKEDFKIGYNFIYCGYIGADEIKHLSYDRIFKKFNNRKLVIWAPHWSIDKRIKELNISTFLDYFLIMIEIAEQYISEIDFVLKPHPNLRNLLIKEEFWGVEKTNQYYDKWHRGVNTSLVDGNYIDLFNESDAIIHDSGAFIVEYLYTGKPAGYLLKDNFDLEFYNDFGKEALKSYHLIKNKNDIVIFLDNLLFDEDTKFTQRERFYNQYLIEHHHNASENVYKYILNSILDVK